MSARKRWTEPELPIGPTDLALVAEDYDEAYARHREDVAMRDAALWSPGECE